MNKRHDFNSIRNFLPPLNVQPSGTITWPNQQAIDALKFISQGSSQSRVNSGKSLLDAILRVRDCLPKSSNFRLATSYRQGFSIFFDELIPKEESQKFIVQVAPLMADLVLRLPSLLETHYQNCDHIIDGVSTGLRLLEPQQPGIVFLSQELIAALLSCSFFCLFPTGNRRHKRMRLINMDDIFASIVDRYHEKQINKLKCIMHYFERICSSTTPPNFVSFERKVLSLDQDPSVVSLPPPDLWANSVVPLCQFKVFSTGLIEDHPAGSLEVDFADQYLGGIVLAMGCLQEEIRFMMNPELIAGMLFLPCMSDNEAIEIIGAERFSNYKGYNGTFKYDGDHVDTRGVDSFQRRVSRVIAIDALERPGNEQYQSKLLLREINKAYCGFLNHSTYQQRESDCDAGIVTGNWGCGVFGGDPEIKSMIQWIAASQASRPFISYYTFGMETLQDLDQVVEYIVAQKWTVGDLWNKLCDYGTQRVTYTQPKRGFFSYLVPSLKQVHSRTDRHYGPGGKYTTEFIG